MVLIRMLRSHDPWLLMLAVGTCLFGAGTGLLFWGRALPTEGRSRLECDALTSVVLGTTIWTTDFVATLGYESSTVATFAVGQTSLPVAIAVVGVAVGSHFVTRLTRARG